MNSQHSNQPVRPAPQQDEDDTLGPTPLELVSFALRSARRHLWLCLFVAVSIGALGIVVVSALPPTYESTSKIYARQNAAITAALAGGRHSGSTSAQGLTETVLNRENIVSMVREAGLVESWKASRAYPLKLKDQLFTSVFGPVSLRDQERALVEMVERSMWVFTEESSIRFRVYWRDPQMAFRLTELAQRNFLRERSAEELGAISRAIALIEVERERADEAIAPMVKEMQRVIELVRAKTEKPNAKAAAIARPQNRAAVPLPQPTPTVPTAEITERLEEIRRAKRNVLEPWQRHNAELNFKLTEMRATLGPEHPSVRQQEAKVRAASAKPPELAELSARESSLMASIVSVGLETEVTRPARSQVSPGVSEAKSAMRSVLGREPEDPELATARLRLEMALSKSRELSERLDSARMELATAQAGLEHRYSVIEPPEVPGKPIKPKRPVLFAGAVLAALLMGFLAGAARELATGRLLEPWQVRRLGFEVLAEVELPETAGPKS